MQGGAFLFGVRRNAERLTELFRGLPALVVTFQLIKSRIHSFILCRIAPGRNLSVRRRPGAVVRNARRRRLRDDVRRVRGVGAVCKRKGHRPWPEEVYVRGVRAPRKEDLAMTRQFRAWVFRCTVIGRIW